MTDPATIYEDWFVPALFAPLARQVLADTDVAAGARVLDVACGSGIAARTAAPRVAPGGSVTGLDANPAMLAAARRAAADALEIDWRQGNAEQLPFPDGSFDLVLCQMGLQFFPHREQAVAEMARVLTPGGQVVISTWRGLDHNPFFAAFAAAVRRHIGSAALETPFVLGDPAQLTALLQGAGFGDVSVAPVQVEANYSRPGDFSALQVRASAAAIPQLQELSDAELSALVAAISAEMAGPVRAATQGDRLRFPMEGLVARGVR